MGSLKLNIITTLRDAGIKTRPKADVGLWIPFLLPVAISVSLPKNPGILSHEYKLATIVATGLIISSVIVITQCAKYKNFKTGIAHYTSTIFLSFLFYTCLHRGIPFSIFSGLISTFGFYKGLPLILKLFPSSFTFGEASLATQGLIFFIYATILSISKSIIRIPDQTSHISTLILQIGITGIGVIALLAYKFKYLRKTYQFYALTLLVLALWIVIPLHVLLDQSPVLWILQLLTDKIRTLHMVFFWIVCTFFAVIAVNKQINKGRKASTSVRKIFHILAVFVYLPGLVDQCSLLYLASGIVFAIFIALEMLRILNLPPLGSHLQDGFVVFSDEKDSGTLALTPLYLLVGCSLPLWIHPDTCDVTDSSGFNLLPLISGLLTLGVGDTFASVIGTWIGRHKWPGTKKTVEGTVACILSQIALVFLLIHSGYIIHSPQNIAKAIFAIIVTSLIEAKTDQVDNLVLPVIMYILLF